MNRRQFLAGTAFAAGGIAGCSQLESLSSGESTLSIGESEEYDGVRITVNDYTTTSEMGERVSVTQDTATRTPSQRNLIFLLTQVTAAHVGETEGRIPNLGPNTYGDFTLSYNGEEIEVLSGVNRAPYYVVDGEEYTGYENQVHDGTGDEPVFDEEYTGWIAHEVHEDFDPGNAELSIQWDGETATWVYSETQ